MYKDNHAEKLINEYLVSSAVAIPKRIPTKRPPPTTVKKERMPSKIWEKDPIIATLMKVIVNFSFVKINYGDDSSDQEPGR